MTWRVHRHSGRSKPWYELSGDLLQHHKPMIGLLERIRDKSYLFSVLASYFQQDAYYVDRLPRSLDIVGAILKSFSEEVSARGARFWLAVHGLESIKLPFDRDTILASICVYAERCLELDASLNHQKFFLSDGHWSNEGHRAVAELIAEQFRARF